MQRNKTVSSLRHVDKGRSTTNTSRTLKGNKSVGHILRKDRTETNLDRKKKSDLKNLTMTPKRGEKTNTFHSKTEVRNITDKNKRFNEKKNEKKITNLKTK